MWFSLKEAERLILNSAVVDSFLNKGTKLYATIYSDPEAQVKFEQNKETIVKGELIDLIKSELPELATLAGIDTTTDGGTAAAQNNTYVDKVLNFIVKYNNLSSTTSTTVTTYQPNDKVIAAMKGNGNISTEATGKLSQDIRDNIENLNTQYELANEKNISNVVSGAQEAITEQENLRKELLGATAQ
jgi:polyhydroxyalkanoate synthesis regulator phasin